MFKSKVAKKSRLQSNESNKTDGKNVSKTVEKEVEPKKTTITTPVSRRNVNREDNDDELPFTMRFTQDSADDDLDVIWDWDSPQSKNNRSLQQRRILHSSPNVPQRRLPYVKGLPMFGSLKAELEELTSKLSAPVSESCLVIEDDGICLNPDTVTSSAGSDLFDDDSFDAEMIKCSQQVEKAFFENPSRNNCIKNVPQCENKAVNCNKITGNKVLTSDHSIKDDSFDVFLVEVKEEHMNVLSQGSSTSGTSTLSQPSSVVNVPTNSPRSIARTNSMPDFHLTKKTVTSTSSSVFPRTKSENLYTNYTGKIRCSPEEIEKKRREARAKLEWKRKQNEIEKRRLEAMERLKRNRLQRMLNSQNGTAIR